MLVIWDMMHHIVVMCLTGTNWGSGSSVEDPKNGVKFQLPNPLTVLGSLGLDAKFLTQHEGRCSYLQVQQNQFLDNIAKYAGGVMYSTDRVSLNITCNEHAIVDNGSLDCGLPSWGGNNIGEYGYGPVIAFPPARVDTDLPSKLTYVSNGVSKLSITAQVSDEAGTHITTGVAFQNDSLIDQHVQKVTVLRVFAICVLSVLDSHNQLGASCAKSNSNTSHMHDRSVEAQLACVHSSIGLGNACQIVRSSNTCLNAKFQGMQYRSRGCRYNQPGTLESFNQCEDPNDAPL